ncbi:MAG: PEP-CTERM sorting domain-containing protein [Gammaproteobacteria bacterium]|nr:PEP-CTERM sorting domain-containing protein [Gammaproteobacteria bacterium]
MKVISFIVFLLLVPFTASATVMSFTDTHDPDPDIWFSAGSNYNYSHDINDSGFTSSTDEILSILLEIDVVDDGDYDYDTYTSYTYTTWCGRHSIFGSYHCHYATGSYISSYGQPEYLTVSADGTVFGSAEIDYNPLGFTIDPSDMQLDGILDLNLTVTSGDLIFRASNLLVEVNRTEDAMVTAAAVPVPAPATVALLGLGLLGLFVSRRRV